MTKYTLKVAKRSITGKKIKQLRNQGLLPGNLFGKNIQSQAIQVKSQEFDRVYKQAGETGIIYLQVDDESKERPTLVSNIAMNPVTGQKLHVDLHQVNLKEKVSAHVPVEIIGDVELIKSGEAVLNQSINEIEIESLPTDIPESIVFDISFLKEIGDHLKVSDGKVSSDVEIKTELDLPVVSLAEPQKEEVVPVEEATEETETSTAAEASTPSESENQPEQ